MNIAKLLIQSFISAFIVMIMIFIIKKAVAGRNVPVVSAIANGV